MVYILNNRAYIMTLLTIDEKELLTKAASLMEELLETLEVIAGQEIGKRSAGFFARS